MKRIILSEGRNDTIFLRELLVTKIPIEEHKILFFDQSSRNGIKHLRRAQDTSFNEFSDDWRRYEILAKSEGGQEKILTVMCSRLRFLCYDKKYDPIMLIDLDGGSINRFVRKLEDNLVSSFQNIGLSLTKNQTYDDNEITMWLVELLSRGSSIGKLHIIAFKSSLEDVIGIESRHTDEQKRELAKSYIERSRIHVRFLEALR